MEDKTQGLHSPGMDHQRVNVRNHSGYQTSASVESAQLVDSFDSGTSLYDKTNPPWKSILEKAVGTVEIVVDERNQTEVADLYFHQPQHVLLGTVEKVVSY